MFYLIKQLTLLILLYFEQVTVETLERGFLINVFSEKNCPGLLVSILEAFEELGLEVLDARVSCSDIFQLQAVGGEVRKTIFFIVFYMDQYTQGIHSPHYSLYQLIYIYIYIYDSHAVLYICELIYSLKGG